MLCSKPPQARNTFYGLISKWIASSLWRLAEIWRITAYIVLICLENPLHDIVLRKSKGHNFWRNKVYSLHPQHGRLRRFTFLRTAGSENFTLRIAQMFPKCKNIREWLNQSKACYSDKKDDQPILAFCCRHGILLCFFVDDKFCFTQKRSCNYILKIQTGCFIFRLWNTIITSSIFLAKPRKSPDISQANSKTNRWEEKLYFVVPA